MALGDKTSVNSVAGVVDSWIRGAKEITPAMLNQMRRLVRDIRSLYDTADEAASRADRVFKSRHSGIGGKQGEDFVTHVKRLPRSSHTVKATVTKQKDKEHAILKAREDLGHRLDHWDIEGTGIKMDRLDRYLCLSKSSREIGWARVGKGRISRVSALNISKGVVFTVEGREYVTEIAALRGREVTEEGGNVEIRLLRHKGEVQVLAVRAWYAPGRLVLCARRAGLKSLKGQREFDEVTAWIDRNPKQFKRAILTEMLESFQHRRAMTGSDAEAFFGEVGTRVEIHAAMERGHPVLVAT